MHSFFGNFTVGFSTNLFTISPSTSAKKRKSQVNLSYDILTPLAAKSFVSAHDIKKRVWIDAESPAVLERRKTDVKKALQQMKIA